MAEVERRRADVPATAQAAQVDLENLPRCWASSATT